MVSLNRSILRFGATLALTALVLPAAGAQTSAPTR
jgi:hypothetical protein